MGCGTPPALTGAGLVEIGKSTVLVFIMVS
jgi:hypothetical protein